MAYDYINTPLANQLALGPSTAGIVGGKPVTGYSLPTPAATTGTTGSANGSWVNGNWVPAQNLYPNSPQQFDQETLNYFAMLNGAVPPTPGPAAPPTGLIGAEQALNTGLSGATSAVQGGVDAATGTLSPYTSAGSSAITLQADLSGANGPAAQQAAFAQYNESPEVAYQREQAEKSVLRNASATGGLQSGSVLSELQRQAVGLAQQDYGNYFNRIGDVAGLGSSAAGTAANIQATGGGQIGDYNYGTGIATAGGRTDAGNAIAGNVSDTTSALADLVAAQGGDLSQIINTGGADLANLLATFGTADAETLQGLATLLANISTGSASQAGGLPALTQQQSDLIGQIGSFLEGGAAAWAAGTASDIRLKTNITPIGRTPGGNTVYMWEWNDEGRRIAGNQPCIGVIAQEVNQDAVIQGPHGYLMVDYSRVH